MPFVLSGIIQRTFVVTIENIKANDADDDDNEQFNSIYNKNKLEPFQFAVIS